MPTHLCSEMFRPRRVITFVHYVGYDFEFPITWTERVNYSIVIRTFIHVSFKIIRNGKLNKYIFFVFKSVCIYISCIKYSKMI